MSRFGYRWWDIGKDGSLQSVNQQLWPPNEAIQAECLFGSGGRHPGERPPAFDCHCGLWAFHDPELASTLPKLGYMRVAKAFGVVESWGDIVDHEFGYRAEWSIPRAIVVMRGRLHAAYEVMRYPSIERLLRVWDIGDPGR